MGNQTLSELKSNRKDFVCGFFPLWKPPPELGLKILRTSSHKKQKQKKPWAYNTSIRIYLFSRRSFFCPKFTPWRKNTFIGNLFSLKSKKILDLNIKFGQFTRKSISQVNKVDQLMPVKIIPFAIVSPLSLSPFSPLFSFVTNDTHPCPHPHSPPLTIYLTPRLWSWGVPLTKTCVNTYWETSSR